MPGLVPKMDRTSSDKAGERGRHQRFAEVGADTIAPRIACQRAVRSPVSFRWRTDPSCIPQQGIVRHNDGGRGVLTVSSEQLQAIIAFGQQQWMPALCSGDGLRHCCAALAIIVFLGAGTFQHAPSFIGSTAKRGWPSCFDPNVGQLLKNRHITH